MDNVLNYFTDDFREEAEAEVAKDNGHRCGGRLERVPDLRRSAVLLRCSDCGWSLEFSGYILADLAEPHARRLAYRESSLAKTLRNQQIASEVREEPPSDASDDDLKDAAKQAMEDRHPEDGMRAIAQIMDPRRQRT